MSSASQAPDTAVYCPGCNQRFAVGSISDCPRCGASLTTCSAVDLQETLLVKEIGAVGNQRGAGRFDDDDRAALEALIGTELHVYRFESLLGCGGMGCVYLAYHKDLQRYSAVKILSRRKSSSFEEFTARFMLEGQAAAALIHPNIVTVHAIGTQEGRYFLEMEFVAGRSLQQLVDEEGRLTPTRAATLTTCVSEGLAAAHREGIVHRDLKLDNVLLSNSNVPKIADFGLAKRIRANASSTGESLCGTPNFMAPELFNGAPASKTSDVYSLGVCFYYLLTGELPYVAGSLQELQQKVTSDPLPPIRSRFPGIPLEMAECLSLLLAKSPSNRPSDGVEAMQLLHAVLGQVRDTESLLAEAFCDVDNVHWQRADQRYRLNFSLPDGRRQKIFIEPSDHSGTGKLLLIYSICCDSQPEYYEEALKLNSEMPHGGIAIREIEGESKFIVVDTYPRATVDSEEIRRSVWEIAYRADAVEKLLTGQDHN